MCVYVCVMYVCVYVCMCVYVYVYVTICFVAVLYCKMCISESGRGRGITTRRMLVIPTKKDNRPGQDRAQV